MGLTKRLGLGGAAVAYFAAIILTSGVITLTITGVVRADGECTQAGYKPTSPSTPLVRNGNFTNTPSAVFPSGHQGFDNTIPAFYYAESEFYSQVANLGDDVYPVDLIPYRNQFSIQNGPFDGTVHGGGPELNQLIFPGDMANDVPGPVSTWLYTNGNKFNGGAYINWAQQISGLDTSKEYVFVAYISSVVNPPANAPDDPRIAFEIGGSVNMPGTGTVLNPPYTELADDATANSEPLNGWMRVAFAFTPSSSSMALKVVDRATGINGDDFAMTAVTLQVCEPQDDWTPIMRAYGNDVFAGGGYFDGSTCVTQGTPVTNPAVKGFGRYSSASPMDHSTYSGTGTELAVFTPGEIMGFLPGANMTTARSALWELSFANTVDNATIKKIPASYNYGGGFGSSYCPSFPTPISPQLRNGATLNISSLPSGDYVVSRASVDIIAPTPIAEGTRIRIFTDGDIFIRNNIQYANVAPGWASAGDIPLVEIYPAGNILVSDAVSEMTGVFKAKGNFYSCVAASNGQILYPNKLPTEYNTPGVGHHMTYIANNCQTKLTVYGSVTAEQMFLYRTTREGLENAVVGENRTSGNLAEAFVFSPEVYLAYLSAHPSSGATVGSPDSVVSLPPVY